ncbi:hypothetical protein [Stetteria hydrogenophila]
MGCIAPPAGEYEVHLETSTNAVLVVNEDGFFLRSFATDEFLPFMTTRDRPVNPRNLEGLVSVDKALCAAVKALREAALHGSVRALRKLESCRSLVEHVEREKCRGGD